MGQEGLPASQRPPRDTVARWRIVCGRVAVWLFAGGSSAMILAFAINKGEFSSALALAGGLAAAAGFVLALSALRVAALAACAGIGVVVAIVAPGFMRACACGGNEASAIGSLRAINSGQASYSSSCAAGGYAVDLADLERAPEGSSQGFIAPDLNRNGVVKSQYVIALARDASPDVTDVSSAASTCNRSTHQPASGYFASASPKEPGKSGTRWFATDTRGTLFFSTTGPVPNPIPKDAQVVQ